MHKAIVENAVFAEYVFVRRRARAVDIGVRECRSIAVRLLILHQLKPY